MQRHLAMGSHSYSARYYESITKYFFNTDHKIFKDHKGNKKYVLKFFSVISKSCWFTTKAKTFIKTLMMAFGAICAKIVWTRKFEILTLPEKVFSRRSKLCKIKGCCQLNFCKEQETWDHWFFDESLLNTTLLDRCIGL